MKYLETYKVFELFDQSNYYEYKFEEEKVGKDEDGLDYTLYVYSFVAKDSTKYYTRLLYYDVSKNLDYLDTVNNFLTLDFVSEEDYSKDVEANYDLVYKNSDKFDAVKIINTVFRILLKVSSELKVWNISFDCTDDRYRTYDYAVNKYFPKYFKVVVPDNGKHVLYLYNNEFYHKDDIGNIVRNDNHFIIWKNDN